MVFRYDFAARERFGGFILGGAGLGSQTGCSLSATLHATGATQNVSCDEVERLSSGAVKFKSFDTGAILGGGLRIRAGQDHVVFSAQYEHGLMRVESDRDVKSRAFTFSGGIEIPLRRM